MSDDRAVPSCNNCVHDSASVRLEPCRSCYLSPALPGFAPKELRDVLREAAAAASPVAVTPTESDPVEHPAHYTRGTVECIDAIEAAVTGLEGPEAVLTGQVLKYLWRWRHKGSPLEDLRKARWYLDRLLARGSTPAK